MNFTQEEALAMYEALDELLFACNRWLDVEMCPEVKEAQEVLNALDAKKFGEGK